MAREAVQQWAKTAFNILGSITMAVMLLIIKDAWAWRQGVEVKNADQDRVIATLLEKQEAVTENLRATAEILSSIQDKAGLHGERIARLEGR